MIFTFIRYTQPGWQFNLIPHSTESFPSCYLVNRTVTNEAVDERYETESARLGDLGYRLWNKGALIEASCGDIDQIRKMPPPSLKDEYMFIKKYWGSLWVNFAFFLRLFSFKNPFKEFAAYRRTRHVERVNLFESPVCYDDYDAFQSSLIASKPFVAVIIPTLNRYAYLKDALHDLEQQTYTHFEVIVVDQSNDFQKAFYNDFQLSIQVIEQKEKLLWTARNKAISATTADYLLFFDDDSRVDTTWIEEHLKCLDFFDADISAGVSFAAQGGKIAENYGYFRWADKLDSGNVMIRRNVIERIGCFDEQFNQQRMGDGEYGLRAYLHGCKSISNYKAGRVHLKVDSGGLRELTGWDAFRPKKLFAPKPVPSMIYLYKKYFPPRLYRNAFLIGMMLSNVPYRYKRSSKMLLFSIFLTALKAPLLLIQFNISNKIALKMLNHKSQQNGYGDKN